jgi:uncharacterized protein
MNINASLSESELDQLAEVLGANGNPDALTLEGMDGLFCALVSSPESVLPHQYLPVIWGGELRGESAFGSLDEADATMSLIMRYWNSVIADLEREAIHLPFIVEPGIDGIVGREWARGFMRGTRLAPTGWAELWQEENEGQVMMIPIVAGEVDPQWPEEPLSREASDESLQWMIAGAGRAYRYFADARRELADRMMDEESDEEFDEEFDEDDYTPETYFRPEPKIGRNEPCPCRSGKKYKKCCGAAGDNITEGGL